MMRAPDAFGGTYPVSLGSASSARMLQDKLGLNTHYIIKFAYEVAKTADKPKIQAFGSALVQLSKSVALDGIWNETISPNALYTPLCEKIKSNYAAWPPSLVSGICRAMPSCSHHLWL